MLKSFMSRTDDPNNLIAATKKFVVAHGIKITDSEIEESFLKNPSFPSLASLTDLLDQFNVNNVALNTRPEHLEQMDYPAIAYLADHEKYILLSDAKDGLIHYVDVTGELRQEAIQEFGKKWSGNLVMAEASETSGDPDYSKKKLEATLGSLRLPITAILLAFFAGATVYLGNHLTMMLVPLFVIGIVVSFIINLVECNKSYPIAEKICKTTKHTNCSKVLASPASKLFGWLHMSDLGMAYFVGSFLSLSIAVVTQNDTQILNLLMVLNLLALPYTLFSVYYQYRVVKAWCTLCLIVQGLFWIQFVTVYAFMDNVTLTEISLNAVLTVLLALSVAAVGLFLNDRKSGEIKNTLLQLNKEIATWKRDPEIFRFLLKNQQPVIMRKFSREILLGRKEAPLTITALINLNCHPCGKALKELNLLLERNPDDFNIAVRFSVKNDEHEPEKNLHIKKLLAFTADRTSEEVFTALSRWFSGDEKFIHEQFVTREADALLQEHIQWTADVNPGYTPALFVGNYLVPGSYDARDLKYVLL